MRYFTCILLIFLSFQCFAGFDDLFLNRTLRIDYYHSGNAKTESFSLDELIQEPTWDRNKNQLVYPFDYGKYKFQAFDSLSDELIYQTSYSTLFGEWQTTPEATTNNRSFHETVLMPFPKSTIKVEFYSRTPANTWEKKWSFYIYPNDILISKENAYQCKTRQLLFNGDPSHNLDIVIIAEGYTKWQMPKFRRDAKRFMNYILDCEPFNNYKEKINFWTVEAHSEESGTDQPGQGIWKKTILNSHFYTFYSDRYLTTYDNKTLRHLASNAAYDQIIVLVNTGKYGGGGFYNSFAMFSSDDNLSNFVVVHEFGHALAGLGDEYYGSDVAMQNFYPVDVEPWEPNLTTLKEFNKKWKDMLKPGTPVPTPVESRYVNDVGVFEGGGYATKGVYRPMVDCTMKSTKYNAFCPVCKKAISQAIEFYTK
ncbi:MAG: M64 family metallo-endopeptidase [Bacteroidetes bacterium]|nr:M64 family metallo-endopeptidase [Bacteroidota bacterium]